MAKLPVALQMYTLRDETAKDFVGTLKKVSEIGYAGVEFAGYGNLSAKELKSVLADLNLQPVSSHIPLDQLENNLDSVIEYSLELGSKYIVCPWLPVERRPDGKGYAELGQLLNSIGEKAAAQGLVVGYHNHDFEFQQFDGQYGLDILFANSNPEFVQMELDCYWAKYSDVDPADYIKKYAGRIPLVHLKDMENSPERAFAEVGTGTLDVDGVIAAAESAGAKWLIVEQDVCKRPPLESIQISYNNLKAKGYL